MSRLIKKKDVTEGIDNNIWKAIDRAIENNDKDSFTVLEKFVLEILHLSVKNYSIGHFQKYIVFLVRFYAITYEKCKYNASLAKLHKDVSEAAASHMRYIIWLGISTIESRSKTLEQRKIINSFYYNAFYNFGWLLYTSVMNGDINYFRFVLNEYSQIENRNYRKYFDLREEIRSSRSADKDDINEREIKNKLKEFEIVKAFYDYQRQVIVGIKYWLFYLYSTDKINGETLSLFIESIGMMNKHGDYEGLKNLYIDSQTILSDLLFFNSAPIIAMSYMGWNIWGVPSKPSRQVYAPADPYNWLVFGFLIDEIRESKLSSNTNLNSKELTQVQFLIDKLKTEIGSLKADFEKWKTVLKVKTIDELTKKCEDILKIFSSFKRISISERERDIVSANLNQTYIDSFKKAIGEAWEYQSILHKQFKRFGNIKYIEGDNKEIKFKYVGTSSFFPKTSFIEKYNEPVYNFEIMGGQTGRWEDDMFFSIIMTNDANKVNESSLLEVLDKSLKECKMKNITPSIILTSSGTFYNDYRVYESNRFISKLDEVQNTDPISYHYVGTFDNIPVYSSFSDFLKNKIVVCDFVSAFQMKLKTNPNWYKSELTVDVKDVSEDIAKRTLSRNPAKWKNTDDGTVLTDDEAIIRIKTSVIIDIWVIVDIEILNKEAYIIGFIKPSLET